MHWTQYRAVAGAPVFDSAQCVAAMLRLVNLMMCSGMATGWKAVKMPRIFFLKTSAPILGLALLTLSLAAPAAAQPDVIRGKLLVEANCSGCHAVGRRGASPHPDAPAFRTLSQRYPLTDLEEALAEGISTGHPDMPEFIASPDQIAAIISYLRSVQVR